MKVTYPDIHLIKNKLRNLIGEREKKEFATALKSFEFWIFSG